MEADERNHRRSTVEKGRKQASRCNVRNSKPAAATHQNPFPCIILLTFLTVSRGQGVDRTVEGRFKRIVNQESHNVGGAIQSCLTETTETVKRNKGLILVLCHCKYQEDNII